MLATSAVACGIAGSACVACPSGDACQAGVCVSPGSGTGTGPACTTLYGKAQPGSAPCCMEYGADACGASFFCAAFDGRTQPVCYPERSRLDGQECTADLQCMSGIFNQEARACAARPGGNCTPEVGCAPLGTQKYGCIGGSCMPLGDGSLGSRCASTSDCVVGSCVGNVCVGAPDDPCSEDEQCASNVCYDGQCCVPKTCAQLGAACGFQYAHCGRYVDCGTCDDWNDCTEDSCSAGQCSHPLSADLKGCFGGMCVSGVCKSTCARCYDKDPDDFWSGYDYYDPSGNWHEVDFCRCDGNTLRAQTNGSLGYVCNVTCTTCSTGPQGNVVACF